MACRLARKTPRQARAGLAGTEARASAGNVNIKNRIGERVEATLPYRIHDGHDGRTGHFTAGCKVGSNPCPIWEMRPTDNHGPVGSASTTCRLKMRRRTMTRNCRCLNCIMPPHILHRLLESDNAGVRKAALNTLLSTEWLRGQRSLRAAVGIGVAPAPTSGRRSIFDCQGSTRLPSAKLVRTEQGPASRDPSVNQAFDGLGVTRDFYQKVFERNSIDGHGHAARRLRAPGTKLQQRVLGRTGDGIRGRRRRALHRLHRLARRDCARAHPRRHRVHGWSGVPQSSRGP